jgi:hypothetical protein
MVQPTYAEPCVPPGHEVVVIANELPEPVPEDEFDEVFEPQPARRTQANGARTNAQRSSPKDRSFRELRPFLRDELAESMRPPLVAANETILSYSTGRKELCPSIGANNPKHQASATSVVSVGNHRINTRGPACRHHACGGSQKEYSRDDAGTQASRIQLSVQRCTELLSTTLSSVPTMTPAPVVRTVEVRVSGRTFHCGAPSAIRMPNSRVRCSTA